MNARRKTIAYFQWLRALGALSIVLLHAFITMHRIPDIKIDPTFRMVEAILSISLTRWAVPVFFMMSGALMLNPERELGWSKMLRHIWRLVFVLLTFGYAFCLIESVWSGNSLSLKVAFGAFCNLLTEHSWDHMWFVYDLLAFYMVTPLIRPWMTRASREEYGRVALAVVLLLLGTRLLSKNLPGVIYRGPSIQHCFAYYFIGSYVHRYLKLNRWWLLAGLASLGFMLVAVLVFGWSWVTDPIRGIVLPYAVLVMLLAKHFLVRPETEVPPVALLADYSFGIYLLHPLFQHLMALSSEVVHAPTFVADTGMVVIPLVLSVVCVRVLRLTPVFADKV